MNDFSINVEIIPSFEKVMLTFATLLVLYLILKKILYKPVTDFMNKRSERIGSNIREAEQLSEEAAALKAEYETRIEEAKEESREIVEAARSRGEELELSIIKEAEEEAENIKTRAALQIEREKATALEEVQKEVGEMAILIASKVLEQELNLEGQNQLIDGFIEEVGSVEWKN